MVRLLGAALVILGTAVVDARAVNVPASIELHRIDNPELLDFAIRFFSRHYPSLSNWSFGSRWRRHEDWATVVREDAYAAESSISDDGAPLLVLVVDSPDWCDDDGCLGAIFRPSGRRYEFICEATLPLAGAAILPQEENGYHLLETKTRVIHWYPQQEFDSGALCTSESR